MGLARGAVGVAAALLLLPGCGDESAPASLKIRVDGAGDVVADAAKAMEDCYVDGSAPETCTTATVKGLYGFCANLVSATELGTDDGIGAVTVYPAQNPRIGELSCLFNNPRSSLSVEIWRDPPLSLCAADGGMDGTCAKVGDGSLEAGRRAELPLISVAGHDGEVVTTVASATLDEDQLVESAALLAQRVFEAELTPEDLAGIRGTNRDP